MSCTTPFCPNSATCTIRPTVFYTFVHGLHVFVLNEFKIITKIFEVLDRKSRLEELAWGFILLFLTNIQVLMGTCIKTGILVPSK